jgi:hypothetical protein
MDGQITADPASQDMPEGVPARRTSPAHTCRPPGGAACSDAKRFWPCIAQPSPGATIRKRASFKVAGCLKRFSNPARPADLASGCRPCFSEDGVRGARPQCPARFPYREGSVPGPRFQPFSAPRKPEIQPRDRSATRARGTPERSGTTRGTASPAASKIALTSPAWPAPSSTTAEPACVKTSGRARASAR